MDIKSYVKNLYKNLGHYLVEWTEVPVKVSVIVPCYNVESYIEKSLSSLIKQSLKEIEIICIDDGSSDSTPEYSKLLWKLIPE